LRLLAKREDLYGEITIEGRTTVLHAVAEDIAFVAVHHLAADGQADDGTGVLIPPVQALEYLEDLTRLLLIEADAVVAEGYLIKLEGIGPIRDDRRRDADAQRPIGAPVFDGIAQKIQKKLSQLKGDTRDDRQLIHLEFGLNTFHRFAIELPRFRHYRSEIYLFERLHGLRHAGKCEQVLDKALHAGGGPSGSL